MRREVAYREWESLTPREQRARNLTHSHNLNTISLLRAVDEIEGVHQRLRAVLHDAGTQEEKEHRVQEYWEYYNSHAPENLQVNRSNQSFENFKGYIRKTYGINNYRRDLLSESQKATIKAIEKAYFNEDLERREPPRESITAYYSIQNFPNATGQFVYISLETTVDRNIPPNDDQDIEAHYNEALDLIEIMQEFLKPNKTARLLSCAYFYIWDGDGNLIETGHMANYYDNNNRLVALPPNSGLFIPKFTEILTKNKLVYELMARARNTNSRKYMTFLKFKITARYTYSRLQITRENVYREHINNNSRYRVNLRGDNVYE